MRSWQQCGNPQASVMPATHVRSWLFSVRTTVTCDITREHTRGRTPRSNSLSHPHPQAGCPYSSLNARIHGYAQWPTITRGIERPTGRLPGSSSVPSTRGPRGSRIVILGSANISLTQRRRMGWSSTQVTIGNLLRYAHMICQRERLMASQKMHHRLNWTKDAKFKRGRAMPPGSMSGLVELHKTLEGISARLRGQRYLQPNTVHARSSLTNSHQQNRFSVSDVS